MTSITTAGLAAALVVLTGALVRPRSTRPVDDTPAPASIRMRRPLAAGLLWRRPRRQVRPAPRSVADWCDAIARSLRAGSTLAGALHDVVPTDPVTAAVSAPIRLALERGRSVHDAVLRVDRPGEDLHLALTVLSTVARVGGPAGQAIDATAATLRQRADDRDTRAVQAAQARLSAHVMTALPLVMLAVLMSTDGDVRSAITGPIGATCVALGLALNGIGWWWMRRIVGSSG
jgi:tight adherence protein B